MTKCQIVKTNFLRFREVITQFMCNVLTWSSAVAR